MKAIGCQIPKSELEPSSFRCSNVAAQYLLRQDCGSTECPGGLLED